MYICIPLFLITLGFLWFNIADEDGFNVIWGWFGWANQTLAVFTLWTITIYLARKSKPYIITLVPAMFMTAVCAAFILVYNNSFALSAVAGYIVAVIVFMLSGLLFTVWHKKYCRKSTYND